MFRLNTGIMMSGTCLDPEHFNMIQVPACPAGAQALNIIGSESEHGGAVMGLRAGPGRHGPTGRPVKRQNLKTFAMETLMPVVSDNSRDGSEGYSPPCWPR